MHEALHRSCFSLEMHAERQDDSVTMTTTSSASHPRLGPAGLLCETATCEWRAFILTQRRWAEVGLEAAGGSVSLRAERF